MEKVFLMKHLMTQKFVFGLLAAFVLALGVQGIADATDSQRKANRRSTNNRYGQCIYGFLYCNPWV